MRKLVRVQVPPRAPRFRIEKELALSLLRNRRYPSRRSRRRTKRSEVNKMNHELESQKETDYVDDSWSTLGSVPFSGKLSWSKENLKDPNSVFSGFPVEQDENGYFIERTDDSIPKFEDEWKEYVGEGGEDQVPDVLYRGERVSLADLDFVGTMELSTTGNERNGNSNGKNLSFARDISFAKIYAVGLDGTPEYYDSPLEKDQIPVGVIYRVNNEENIIDAAPDHDPMPFGEMQGLCREFTIDGHKGINSSQYDVVGFYIMDDYVSPHTRSDERRPMEYFPVENPDKLKAVTERIKNRIDEL